MNAQTSVDNIVRLTVLDNSDKTPIEDVLISILNSTSATTTDKNGNLEFAANEVIGKDLLLTHISYETSIHYFEIGGTVTDTILMSKQSVKIEDVVVKSKKSKHKKRWLSIFEQDVFGPYWKSKKMKINNEEDILFSEQTDSLTAYGNDVLEFENKELGYKIRFLLEDYIHKKGYLKYKGKAWFEDLKVGSKKMITRRNKIWRYSSRAFLQNVLTNSYKEAGFDSDLFSSNIYKINLDGIYAAIVPSNLVVKSTQGNSIIHAKNNLIIFNDFGEILNRHELLFSGYWKSLTLADLIPSNFTKPIKEPSIPFDKTFSIGEVRAKVNSQIKKKINKNVLEAIVITTDKQLYNSTEYVYLSASILDVNLNTLIAKQQLLNFEVYDIDTKKLIVKKSALTTNGKAQQSFKLDNKFTNKQYVIVAYTDYMKRFSTANFGKASFIVDLKPIQKENKFSIEWYPEGGNLIIDKPNKIVFKVRDQKGIPAKIDQVLIDNFTGEQLAIKTLTPGLGVLQITPNRKSSYTFKTGKSINQINDLNPTQGATLSVLNNDKDFLIINTISYDSLKAHSLIIDQNDIEVFRIDNLTDQQICKISRTYLPTGPLNIKLYDAQYRIISTRSVLNTFDLNKAISINNDYAFYYPKQKAQFNIGLDSTTMPLVAELNWTVSICHENKLIDHPLLLDSSLKTNAKHYLKDLLSITTRNNSPWSKKTPQAEHASSRELFLKVKGTILDLKSQTPISGKVNLMSLQQNAHFDEIITDSSGHFIFDKIPYEPDVSFIVQARKTSKKRESKFNDPNVLIKFDSIFSEIDIHKVDYDLFYNDKTDINWVSDTTDVLEEVQYFVELDQISIRSKVMRDKYDLIDTREYSNPKAPAKSVLHAFIPNMILKSDPDSPGFKLIENRNTYRGIFWQKFYLSINGFQTRDFNRLNNYLAEDLAWIKLSGNNLSIFTNNETRYLRLISERSKGINVFTHDYLLDTTAYVEHNPNQFPNVKDNRTTLYWNPNYQLSTSDTNKIEFYTSDITGNYLLTMKSHHPQLGELVIEKKIKVATNSQ